MHRKQRSRHSDIREQFAHCRHSRSGRGGPRARRGDIRAAILALLAERPMHGYEMIKELEQRTGGAWVPSAGSIYPTLQLLEDEGLIRGEESDGKRRFTLTEAGTAAAAEREAAPPWEDAASGSDSEVVRLKHSLVQLNHSIAQVFHAADDEQPKRIRELLDETRRQIYGVLAEES